MRNIKKIIVFLGMSLFLSGPAAAQTADQYELCPWGVGQFVEYQIISLENEGRDNRYKLEVSGRETIEGIDYFWIKQDIFESGERRISFKILTQPFSRADFSRDPGGFISEGMLRVLRNAKKVFVLLENGREYEINPDVFVSAPDILAGTFYKNIPDERNAVDYRKLVILQDKETIVTPAGVFNCEHFLVETSSQDPEGTEGFDLWRSSRVPFFGIVRLEFSKTKHDEKQRYRYQQFLAEAENFLTRLIREFFNKHVLGRVRSDVYEIKLLSFGAED